METYSGIIAAMAPVGRKALVKAFPKASDLLTALRAQGDAAAADQILELVKKKYGSTTEDADVDKWLETPNLVQYVLERAYTPTKQKLMWMIGQKAEEKGSYAVIVREAFKGAEHKFSCVMVAVPEELGRRVEEWGRKNIKEDHLFVDEKEGIWGLEDQPHITVKYGLHDNKPTATKRILARQSPVRFRLGKVMLFKNADKPYDVVNVNVVSDDLHWMNNRISQAIECTDSYPLYKPHLCIGYVKSGKADRLVGKTPFDGEQFEIGEVEFSSKSGAVTKIKLSSETYSGRAVPGRA